MLPGEHEHNSRHEGKVGQRKDASEYTGCGKTRNDSADH